MMVHRAQRCTSEFLAQSYKIGTLTHNSVGGFLTSSCVHFWFGNQITFYLIKRQLYLHTTRSPANGWADYVWVCFSNIVAPYFLSPAPYIPSCFNHLLLLFNQWKYLFVYFLFFIYTLDFRIPNGISFLRIVKCHFLFENLWKSKFIIRSTKMEHKLANIIWI